MPASSSSDPKPPISPSGSSAPDDIVTVVQDPPRGTGDAVQRALTALPEVDRLVVLYCDHPLLEPSTVAKLLAGLRASGARVAILTATVQDPAGYGRIVRDADRATGGDRRATRR